MDPSPEAESLANESFPDDLAEAGIPDPLAGDILGEESIDLLAEDDIPDCLETADDIPEPLAHDLTIRLPRNIPPDWLTEELHEGPEKNILSINELHTLALPDSSIRTGILRGLPDSRTNLDSLVKDTPEDLEAKPDR